MSREGLFRQAVFNAVFVTDALKQAHPGLFILLAAGKLNAVIGREGVDFTGRRFDNMA